MDIQITTRVPGAIFKVAPVTSAGLDWMREYFDGHTGAIITSDLVPIVLEAIVCAGLTFEDSPEALEIQKIITGRVAEADATIAERTFHSDETFVVPERGRISVIDGNVWVSLEEVLSK